MNNNYTLSPFGRWKLFLSAFFLLFALTQARAQTCTPPTITSVDVTQPTCATPTGSIEVNATGSGTLEYGLLSWSPQTSGTTVNLWRTWGADASNVWAVGIDGTILKWDGTSWAAQTSGTTATLVGVWGTDVGNVWAVGSNGTILKWDGSSWAAQTSGTTESLRGVWGTDASNVWAVGGNSTILKYDGTSWTAQTSGSSSLLQDVWAADANNVWAVGTFGEILKWDGTTWTAQIPPGTAGNLFGIWGTDASNVWAVGTGGTILKWDGTTWTAQPSGTTQLLARIWGTDASNVWAVGGNGGNGTILKYDGTSWTAQTSGTTATLWGVWGSDASNVWAVGLSGTILNYSAGGTWQTSSTFSGLVPGDYDVAVRLQSDPTCLTNYASNPVVIDDAPTAPAITSVDVTQPTCATPTGSIEVNATGSGTLEYGLLSWSPQTSGTTVNLWRTWGADASNVWAVGIDGTILKWDGTSWAAQTSGTTATLVGVWGTDVGNVWAVGSNGTILKWDGSSWAAQTSGTTESLRGVWGTDASNVWAVGGNSTILKYDGTSWTAQASGSSSLLQDVWAADANNVWAVGTFGEILKWDGTNWSPQIPPGTAGNLFGIWGTDASNVWAVGTGGTILKWDGTTWTAQPSGTTQLLARIWGTDASNVWAVGGNGGNGTILKYDGTSWTAQTSGTTATLWGVWGSDASNVWAVGLSGTILNYSAGGTWQTSSTFSGLVSGDYDVAVRLQSDPTCVTTYASNPVTIDPAPSAPSITSVDVTQPTCATPTGSIEVNATGSGTLEYGTLAWAAQTSGSTENLLETWGTDANNIWAVGFGGTILKWDGTSWAAQTSGTTEILVGVWGTDTGNVWAVGLNGTILKWDGSSWAAQTSGTTESLRGVWGTDASNVWTVGDNGTILKWDGSSWTAQTSGTTELLTGIWGTDAGNVWAVGWSGTILKWDGSSWAAQSSGTTELLNSVWGTDAGNVWAVGENGTILKYDGSNWSTQSTGITNQLFDVWGTDVNNIWACGGGGAIIRFNGTNWSSQVSNTTVSLRGIWGSDVGNVQAVGFTGTIINYTGSNWQNSPTISGLAPGSYDVAAREQSNPSCVTTYTSNPVVIDDAPTAPAITSVDVTQPTCATPTGSITVNATGSGTLEYSVDDGANWGTSNTFSGQSPGSYNVKVRLQSDNTCETTHAGNPVVLNAPTGCGGPCLTTLFAGGFTGQNGNMFDITNNGTQDLTINSFEININAAVGTSVNVEVYYTTSANTYVGNEATAANWTQLGTATVTSQGANNPTPVPIGGLVLAPGESKGLYVTTHGGAPLVYTNGTSTHDDGTLLIDLDPGIAIAYPFGQTFTPRQWNGTICYSVGGGGPTAEALDFDGTDDYVDITPFDFYASDFTVEGWFNAEGSNSRAIFAANSNATSSITYIEVTNDDRLRFFYRNPPGNTGGIQVLSDPGVVTGGWQHFAAVYGTDGKVRLYLDGALIGESSGSLSPVASGTAASLFIGQNVPGNPRHFHGKMDEFRIWNYARTLAEIDCQKDIELTGSEPGLLAYYNFNQGIAGGSNAGVTTLDDLTSNNHDGTLTNFALTGTTSNWVVPGPTLTGAPCPSCQPTLNVTGTITSGTYEAQNALTSDGTVPNSSTVELKADNEVLLNANFEVILGGVLDVIMEGCTPLTGEEEGQ